MNLLRGKNRFKYISLILIILIIASVILSLNLGSFSMEPLDVIKTLFGQGSKKEELVLFTLRLPRIVIAILVAIGLSTSGVILQGVTKNDLADSGILGIGSGAALAVVVYIYFTSGNTYATLSDLTIYTMPLIALLGGFVSSALIYSLAWKKGINPSRLILIGIGINSAFSAALIIFQLKFTTQEFNRVMIWISGSIWGSNWKYVMAVTPWIVVFLVLTLYKARYLDVINLGDELSTGLGVKVEKERRKLLVFAVALAGAATAVSGTISFLGLIAPHIGRRLVGPKHKVLIPTSALISIFLFLVSDMVAKNLLAPVEIPVGIVISILGVPYFVYLMLKQ
ncbi:iron ABC transporter permease [Clostridium sp. YIM B02505]|uniref:Iron ABC transporter permease n=1 Tax=Clostridium yunnanense TaxID=2800325 RepID=A0ABS1EKZ3_9CLOT|nr:iron ABC transporter permease [Clostridium yunnanense]MBK1810018.1 iron ABC transporter permease [Clostridium yunnanense]